LDEISAGDVKTGYKAIVSLVFAASSLEAFVNELPALAEGLVRNSSHQQTKIEAFADLMNELEQSRASFRAKLLFAKWILSGVPFDKGASPYQDVTALIDIRNSLLHMKGSDVLAFEDNVPKFRVPSGIKFLQSKKLAPQVLPDRDDGSGSWTEAIRNIECAKWACNTVATVVKEIIGGLPEYEPWPVIRKACEDSYQLR
jgi:hypothetical protein